MMKYSAIVLLGGSSSRFNKGDGLNKVYQEINHKPLFLYSVEAFLADQDCEKVIVVYNKNDLDILNKYLDKRFVITEGGQERYESVMCGLKLVTSTYVLVHDGARPYINQELIDHVKNGLEKSKCVSLGLPVSDTIKQVCDGKVTTISRENLFQMQTPQGSVKEDLSNVLSKIKKEDKITDDLMAFEKYSDITPLIVLGDKKNIKITTFDDYEYMKYLMEKKNV